MANEDIKYKVSLEEEVSAKLQKAEKHADHFENKLKHLHHTAEEAFSIGHVIDKFGSKMIEAVSIVGLLEKAFEAVGEAIEKAFEFGKEAFNEYRDLIKKEGTISLLLRNSPHAEGINKELIDSLAEKRSEELGIKKNAALDIERQLLNTQSLANNVSLFKKVEQLSYNMAAGKGQDASAMASTITSAFTSPRGIRGLLREGGVTMTAGLRREMIEATKNDITGMKLQAVVIDALNEKYKDQAQFIADLDPLTPWNRVWNKLEEEVGPKVAALITELTPYFDGLINKLSDWVESIDEDDVRDFADGIVSVVSDLEEFGSAIHSIVKWINDHLPKDRGKFMGTNTHPAYAKAHPNEVAAYSADMEEWERQNNSNSGNNFITGFRNIFKKNKEGGFDKLGQSDLDKYNFAFKGYNIDREHQQEYLEDIVKKKDDKRIYKLLTDGNELEKFQIREIAAFHKEDVENAKNGHPAQNALSRLGALGQLENETSSVTGTQPKIININMPNGMVKEITMIASGMPETKAKMKQFLEDIFEEVLNESQEIQNK